MLTVLEMQNRLISDHWCKSLESCSIDFVSQDRDSCPRGQHCWRLSTITNVWTFMRCFIDSSREKFGAWQLTLWCIYDLRFETSRPRPMSLFSNLKYLRTTLHATDVARSMSVFPQYRPMKYQTRKCGNVKLPLEPVQLSLCNMFNFWSRSEMWFEQEMQNSDALIIYH